MGIVAERPALRISSAPHVVPPTPRGGRTPQGYQHRRSAGVTGSQPVPSQRILVLDCGAQYSQLIARKVREQQVYAEIVPCDLPAAEIARRQPAGLILSGGPASVYEDGAPACDPGIWQLGVPVLGICYGLQLLAHQLGGEVRGGGRREYGAAALTWQTPSPLSGDLPPTMDCWMSHGDAVQRLPAGFAVLATTASCGVAAAGDVARRLYGVQFHPEVTHTPQGSQLLANFVHQVCGCDASWTMGNFVERAVAGIRAQVGTGRVLCALSGGVDSAVMAALVHRAIGQQLTCVFVDHGLLRAGERDDVERAFGGYAGLELIVVDATERFMTALAGVDDPERKRKIIGAEFINTFRDAQRQAGEFGFLAQGTIYPDVIESGSSKAATIKSHHNVGGLPAELGFELVEPLRLLFKDEVRRVGEELGLPTSLVWRQPFPGPGLAVRVLGDLTAERIRMVRESDAILRAEVAAAGLERQISQYFTVLAPVRSVGVMGDARTYAHPIIIRAVVTDDFMTARPARLPHELLERIATRIVNEVRGINRCLFDYSSKPPATIEWE
ncbi:MAG: glutamine-hydrolyzing GMP synthase [Fimbriimonadaceae bacterium]|nr:glutamine-hydrolyzing GMP synthase [Fimbriimonadaceae bacterium]